MAKGRSTGRSTGRSASRVSRWVIQIVFFLIGAVLTGFLTVFLARFFGHFVWEVVAVPAGVGLAVCTTLWLSQLVAHPPFMLSGTSPLIAGFCAALGVHVSRVWLG